MAQRDISSNDNVEKLAKEAQPLALEKEKQDWKFNCWFDKKRKLREAELRRGEQQRSCDRPVLPQPCGQQACKDVTPCDCVGLAG